MKPRLTLSYLKMQKRGRPRKFRLQRFLVSLLVVFLMTSLSVLLVKFNSLKVKAVLADTYKVQINQDQIQKQKEDEQLKEYQAQLLRDAKVVKGDPETVKVITHYVNQLWGKDAPTALAVFTCESHLDPQEYHVNYGSSLDDPNSGYGVDFGVSQLNYHSQHARFQKMIGGDLKEMRTDIYSNLLVAHAIYQEQGWKPWNCAKVLGYVK